MKWIVTLDAVKGRNRWSAKDQSDEDFLAEFASEVGRLGALTWRELTELCYQGEIFCMSLLVEGFELVYLEDLDDKSRSSKKLTVCASSL
jgi:hypothetical protein